MNYWLVVWVLEAAIVVTGPYDSAFDCHKRMQTAFPNGVDEPLRANCVRQQKKPKLDITYVSPPSAIQREMIEIHIERTDREGLQAD